MNNFYVDADLRANLYYVVPLKQDREHVYSIQFKQKQEADDFARRLNGKIIKTPIEEPKKYKLIEVIGNNLGNLHIYRFL